MDSRLRSKEVRLPKFDLAVPCQYFKSSFAKTLSHSSQNNAAKSLDYYGLPGQITASSVDFHSMDDVDKFTAGLEGASQQNGPVATVESNGMQVQQENVWNIQTQDIKISSTTTIDTHVRTRALSENRKSILTSRKSFDSSEVEVLRLRKECQNLIEENRRLLSLTTNGNGHIINGNGDHCSTVEAVILQNQVETLQWQLKQVESSRLMYRAVMEEVVRFLDRCHHSLDAIQLSALINGTACGVGSNGVSGHHGRSKSVLHVSKCNDSDSSGTSSPRARSSTNLIDVQKNLQAMKGGGESGGGGGLVAPPPGSYNNFRDYTWRRSPKSTSTLPISMNEVEPEKLSKEAFRLLRTIQNLLNTQEPALTNQPVMDSILMLPTERASSACSSAGNCEISSDASSVSGGGTSGFGMRPLTHTGYHNSPFNRKMNSRDSRMSLRSSTDDSVHSSSSSAKTETDDDSTTDRPSPTLSVQSSTHLLHNHTHQFLQHRTAAATANGIERIKDMMLTGGGGGNGSTEDESGFSSMNSFQDIGLPISHSTMLSSASGSDESVADLETTLKANGAMPPTVPPPPLPRMDRNGLPDDSVLPPQLPPHHRRWDSAPIVPPKFKLQTMSTNDDALRVLWV